MFGLTLTLISFIAINVIKCPACHPDCTTCAGPNSWDCNTCSAGRNLNWNSPPNSCCHVKCFTCWNTAYNCHSCMPAQGWANPSTGLCIPACLWGTWPNIVGGTGKQCVYCHPTCGNCLVGSDANQCTACNFPRLGPNPFGYCESPACYAIYNTLPNTYQWATSNSCIGCDGLYQFWMDDGNNRGANYAQECMVCPPQTGPLDSAPFAYFWYSNDKTCHRCDRACLTCSVGSGNNQCDTCRWPRAKNNNNTLPDICCTPGCLLCTSSNAWDCTECNMIDNWHQNGGFTDFCISACPSNQYGDTSDSRCKNCNAACLRCYGSSNNQCSACVTPTKFLDPLTTTCSLVCPNHYYAFNNAGEGECPICDVSCNGCNGPSIDNCTSCTGSMLKQYNTATSRCYDNCSMVLSTYPDYTTNKCTACNPTCYKCLDATAFTCTSCAQYLFLQTSPGPSQCVQSILCATHQYGSSANICEECPVSCLTCGGLTGACLSCDASNAVSPLYLQTSNGLCLSNCGATEYKLIYGNLGQCVACYYLCLSCVGYGASNCTSCISFYQLNQSPGICSACGASQFFDSNGKCQKSCLSGQYGNPQTHACQPCDPSCVECNGSLNTQCTKCIVGLFLLNNQCQTDCQSFNQIQFSSSNQEQQNSLQFTYVKDYSANECILQSQCFLPKIISMDQTNLQEYCACPDGLIFNNQLSQCNCPSNLQLHPTAFFSAVYRLCGCMLGQYLSQQQNSCLDCLPNCYSCEDGQSCTVCLNQTQVLQDGNCLDSCLKGYVITPQTVQNNLSVFQDIGICVRNITVVQITLNDLGNPLKFQISFDKDWINLFSQMRIYNQSIFKINISTGQSYLDLNSTSIPDNQFSYILTYSKQNVFILDLDYTNFDFSKYSAKFQQLVLNFFPLPLSDSESFQLQPSTLKIDLKSIRTCSNNTDSQPIFYYYQKGICVDYTSLISLQLATIKNQNSLFEVQFNIYLPDLITYLIQTQENSILINITSWSQDSFQFKIFYKTTSQSYLHQSMQNNINDYNRQIKYNNTSNISLFPNQSRTLLQQGLGSSIDPTSFYLQILHNNSIMDNPILTMSLNTTYLKLYLPQSSQLYDFTNSDGKVPLPNSRPFDDENEYFRISKLMQTGYTIIFFMALVYILCKRSSSMPIRILQYVFIFTPLRYYNVRFPPNAQYVFLNGDSWVNSGFFGFNLASSNQFMQSVKQSILLINQNFVIYNIDPTFFNSYGGCWCAIVGLFLVSGIVYLQRLVLSKQLRPESKHNKIIHSVMLYSLPTFMIMSFFPLTVYAMLSNVLYSNLDTPELQTSFSLAILTIIVSFLAIAYLMLLIRKFALIDSKLQMSQRQQTKIATTNFNEHQQQKVNKQLSSINILKMQNKNIKNIKGEQIIQKQEIKEIFPIKSKQTEIKQLLQQRTFMKLLDEHACLFLDYKTLPHLAQLTPLYELIYFTLIMILNAVFVSHPIEAIAMSLSFTILMTVYYCLVRPIKTMLHNVFMIFILIILDLTFISVLVLCIYDQQNMFEDSQVQTRQSLGYVIIFTQIIIEYSSIAFLATKLIQLLIVKQIKNSNNFPLIYDKKTSSIQKKIKEGNKIIEEKFQVSEPTIFKSDFLVNSDKQNNILINKVKNDIQRKHLNGTIGKIDITKNQNQNEIHKKHHQKESQNTQKSIEQQHQQVENVQDKKLQSNNILHQNETLNEINYNHPQITQENQQIYLDSMGFFNIYGGEPISPKQSKYQQKINKKI